MNRRERRRLEALGEAPPQAPERAVNTAKARVRAAENRLEAGDAAGAAEALKEATRLDPANGRAWYLQAMIDVNAGRLDEAGDAIVKATMGKDADADMHANCSAIMNLCARPMEAEAAARHALELSPDMPEAYCNLGVALEAQGKAPAALDALVKAVELRPGYVEALISLGNLKFRGGDQEGAVEAFADAVRAQPTNVMARTNLAIALRLLGELSSAEQQCLEALGLDPNYAEAHNALGNVRLQLGDLPGAVSAFKDAVARRDPYPEARANLAAALFKSGDLQGAEDTYIDTLERHPTFAEAAQGLGVVLLAAGRIEEAERRFRRAVEIRPSLGEAWMNIVDAKGKDLSDGDLKVLREKSADARLAEEDRIGFLFALGAAEDARGDFDAAFEAYRTANDRRRRISQRSGTTFDAGAFDAEVGAVIDTFDADVIKGLAEKGDPEARPVFICGMPRSGTTLIEQILAAHPDVRGAGEVDIVSGLLDDYPAGVPGLSAADIRALSDTYLARLPVSARDGQIFTDKTPQNVFFAGLIKAMFPNARFIHCVRDARDTALSCYFQNFRSGGLDWSSGLEDIAGYQQAERRMAAHWAAAMPDALLQVRYEDVVADLKGAAERLLEFCVLEWNDAVLQPDKTAGTVLTASNWQVRKPVYSSSVARWRNYEKHLAGIPGLDAA